MKVELLINDTEEITFINVRSVKIDKDLLIIIHNPYEYLSSKVDKYPINIVKEIYTSNQ